MKAMEYALWSVWLSGFLMICLSFYIINNSASSLEYPRQSTSRFSHLNLGFEDELSVTPKITIFTSPDPFSNAIWFKMSLSVSSWIQLSKNISVVLFSRDLYVHQFADEFGPRVSVDPNVDFAFLGTPFFHSMVARTQAYKSDITVLVDRETILLPDFISTLRYAHELDLDWFLFALPRNITRFSFQPDEDGHHWLDEDAKDFKMKQMQEFLSQVGHLANGEERMLMAWNNVGSPLHIGVVPPFLYMKGVHNQWTVNEIFSSNIRFIFDATDTISSFFETEVDPRWAPLPGHSTDWKAENVSWEYDVNRYMATRK
uniref:Nucleotide-diphospho-sugar transferase domain-containing protein n=1 Tax=Kalanchoe fedtschenkoi TaxID=63787 RepID=A0A7N0TE05_KALFE